MPPGRRILVFKLGHRHSGTDSPADRGPGPPKRAHRCLPPAGNGTLWHAILNLNNDSWQGLGLLSGSRLSDPILTLAAFNTRYEEGRWPGRAATSRTGSPRMYGTRCPVANLLASTRRLSVASPTKPEQTQSFGHSGLSRWTRMRSPAATFEREELSSHTERSESRSPRSHQPETPSLRWSHQQRLGLGLRL
jgi:hypothetical protein